MGERLLCKQEAVGSIPSGSTRIQTTEFRGQRTEEATRRSIRAGDNDTRATPAF